jgi:hypothetical protein
MFYFFNTILKQIIKLHVGQTEYYYSALVIWLYLFTALCVLRVTRRVNCRYRIWLTRLTKHLKIVDKTVAGQSILFPSICACDVANDERIEEIFLMASLVSAPTPKWLYFWLVKNCTAILIKIVPRANYFFVLDIFMSLHCQHYFLCTVTMCVHLYFSKNKIKRKEASLRTGQ